MLLMYMMEAWLLKNNSGEIWMVKTDGLVKG